MAIIMIRINVPHKDTVSKTTGNFLEATRSMFSS